MIDAWELRTALCSGEEIAIIDPREEGLYGKAHLLSAVNVPLSRLELLVERLVPRKSTRIVLTDAGDGLSQRSARKFRELDYSCVEILGGGIAQWRSAGFELFSGMSVLTKGFGEWIAVTCGTPLIEAAELHRKIQLGEKVIVLDSRPADEYRNMNIPGSLNVPVSELVYRFDELALSPDTFVVVNCAGRTRSLIGAQSLINAGVPHTVAALKGGTMAWQLAGFQLEHGSRREARAPSPSNLEKGLERARSVACRFGVKCISQEGLESLKRQSASRSLYLLDVRTPGEFHEGHRPDSHHAWGVQLVQSVEKFVATRNARIVLVDNMHVRSLMTASWLVQAGFSETFVLENPFAGLLLEEGRGACHRIKNIPSVSVIEVTQAAELVATGETGVIDFSDSMSYKSGHIPGAWFSIRSRLAQSLRMLPETQRWLATGNNRGLTALAAAELAELSGKPVTVLEGGTSAWSDAGFPVTSGYERLASAPDDIFPMPFLWGHFDEKEAFQRAAHDYFAWEVGLPEQIERSGEVHFPSGTDHQQ